MAVTQNYVSRFVRAGKYLTHYIEWGDGEPVVMVHGGGPGASGEFAWRNNIGAIGHYGRGIGIDLIGYGLTDKPTDILYSYQAMVNHLADFMDALCLEQLSLTGNSMGAYVIAKYALDHPERVKKLLLVGSGSIATAMGLDMGMTTGLKQLVNYDGTKESLRGLLKGLMHHPENITEEQLEKRYQQAQLTGVMEAQQSFLEYFRGQLKENPNQAQLFDIRHRLPRLTIPIRFIWGRHDIFASPELAEKLQKMVPNAEFVFFEDSGHVVQNDEPERYNEAALEFFFNVTGKDATGKRAAGD